MKSKFWLNVFEETPGKQGGGGGNITGSPKQPMSAEDDLKFLREGQEEEPEPESEPEPKVKRKAKVEDEPEEDTEDVDSEEEDTTEETEDEGEEDETEDEEEDEEETVGALVTARDLKAKYPDIFKKVPELRQVIYREQQYSQIFADPKEAQEASNLATTFRDMESDLVQEGDIGPILSAVKNTKGSDFNKLVSNILPAIKKIDEPTFMKVIAVPLKQILRAAFADGAKKGNKNLQYAAQHVHDFVFDDTNLDQKAEFEQEPTKTNPEEEKYKKKLEEIDARDHDNFKFSVDSQWFMSVAEEFNSRLDPDGVFSKWAKDKMLEDAVKEINKQLVADTRHMKNMEVMWRNAKASGYSAESKSRIVNAALARAKQLIPAVRQKLRTEALSKGERKSNSNGNEQKKTFRPREEVRNDRERPKRKDPRSTESMSDLDIIKGM